MGKHPIEGKLCRPGSQEQQLDMCETGELRGNDIEERHGRAEKRASGGALEPLSESLLESNFSVDLSEAGREGDEESGDEHSAGLQGDEEQELQYDDQPGESDAGLPGEMTGKIAHDREAERDQHHNK